MTDTATPLPFTLANHDEAPTRGGSSLDAMPCCGSLDLRLADCMEVMAGFSDGYFDLAVVDPPYGINASHMGSRFSRYSKDSQRWDKETPPPQYFVELRRVSKHQIIWGGNYFNLPPSRCFLIWDKQQPAGVSFADSEFAWTSFDASAKTFRRRPQGADEERIHPTQKPVDLYKWTLANYAKPGMRVLDTHMGSGSIAIAAHYAGVHLTACEIDPDYYEAAKARISRETSQTELFIHHNATVQAIRTGAPADNE